MRNWIHPLLATLLTFGLSAPTQAQNQTVRTTQAAAHADEADHELPKHAVAVLIPTQGNQVRGVIMLTQQGDEVHITGKVTNLTPGEHGFHIHEFGDLRSADGTSAGGHYGPEGHQHGGPEDEQHHAGDLGNIRADQSGQATIDIRSKDLKVHFTLGRAVVVHADPDDFKSQPSGNAGARVAVGVIGVADSKTSQPATQR